MSAILKSLMSCTRLTIYDPWAKPSEVAHEYNLKTTQEMPSDRYDTIILGVAHNEFLELDMDQFRKENAVIYDVKGVLKIEVDGCL